MLDTEVAVKPDRVIVRLRTSQLVFLSPASPVAWRCLPMRQDGEAVLAALRGSARDPAVTQGLRTVCEAFHPGIGLAADFEDLAQRVATAAAEGLVHVYRVSALAMEGTPSAVAARPDAADDRAVPFIDDDSKPVLDPTGGPMQRPAGLDPHVFVNEGTADQRIEMDMARQGAGTGILGYMLGRLTRFKQGGPWDAQRFGGRFHREFVDYATVVIGLYAAASGMRQSEILEVENGYAALFSRYPAATLMDRTYTHLPARNVANTVIGFQLHEARRIRPTGNRKAAG
jgi:hypothetical protein